MKKISAGILMYRVQENVLHVFLAHPGGPYWTNKDIGAWSVPKGLPGHEEDLLSAAKREFEEETGFRTSGSFVPLTPVKQKSGKVIHAWAVEGECNPAEFRSNLFSMEWPPRSGKQMEFPEIDRAEWFEIAEAKKRIQPGQLPLLLELQEKIKKI
jgi:predicted NUDIX family NTP pyrophosphohydrolase